MPENHKYIHIINSLSMIPLIAFNAVIILNSFIITENILLESFFNLIPYKYVESSIISLFLLPLLNSIPDLFSYTLTIRESKNDISTTLLVLLGSSTFVLLNGLSIIFYEATGLFEDKEKFKKYLYSTFFAILALANILFGIIVNFNPYIFIPSSFILYFLTIIILSSFEKNETKENIEQLEIFIFDEIPIETQNENNGEILNTLSISRTIQAKLYNAIVFLNNYIYELYIYCLFLDGKKNGSELETKQNTSLKAFLKITLFATIMNFIYISLNQNFSILFLISYCISIGLFFAFYIFGLENIFRNLWNMFISFFIIYFYITFLFKSVMFVSKLLGIKSNFLVVLVTSWENGFGDVVNIKGLSRTNKYLALYSTVNSFTFNSLILFCISEGIFVGEHARKLSRRELKSLIVAISGLGGFYLMIFIFGMINLRKRIQYHWSFPSILYVLFVIGCFLLIK